MAITLVKHRAHLGKVIIVSSIALVISLIVLYILKGFRPDEFEQLCKLLAPIYTLYVGAVIRHVIANPNKKTVQPDDEPEIELNEAYISTSKIFVYGHLIIILSSIWLFGLFHIVDFSDFTSWITIIEVVFGGYAGLFLTHLFANEKSTENN
jgi:hypothetical protein